MAGTGGKREGAGRPKGVLNKDKRDLQKLLDSMDCKPELVLAKVCNGEPLKCRLSVGDSDDDFIDADVLPTFDQRMAAAKELMGYVHAKRKAVEHSTFDEDGDLTGIKVIFPRGSDS